MKWFGFLCGAVIAGVFVARMQRRSTYCHVCPMYASHGPLLGRFWCYRHFHDVLTGRLVVVDASTGRKLLPPAEDDEEKARNLFNQLFSKQEQGIA